MLFNDGKTRRQASMLAVNISELTLKLLAATVQALDLRPDRRTHPSTDRGKNSLQIRHQNLRKTHERHTHTVAGGCRVWRCGWRRA